MSSSIKPDFPDAYSASSVAVSEGAELIPFFGIGLVVNLVVFAIFLIWAINHWNEK